MATAEQIKNRVRVLTFIIAYPEFHDQADYMCGTTACIAGTVLLFDLFDNDRDKVIDTLDTGQAYGNIFPEYAPGMENCREFDKAMSLLGLTEDQADDLFYELGEMQAIKKLALLAAEEPDET